MKYLYLILFMCPGILFSGEWVQKHLIYNEIPISIDCPDSLNCFVLVQDDLYTRLYKTTDQGVSWEMLYQSDPFHEEPPYIVNAKGGASPDPKYYYISFFETGIIKVSTDSGRTFSRVDLGIEYSIMDIEMYNYNYGVAVWYHDLFITEDCWDTFNQINEGLPPSIDNPVFHNKDTLFFIVHGQNIHGFAIYDIHANIWEVQYFETACYLNDIHFVNDTLGFICAAKRLDIGDTSSDIIFRTKNGGKDWERVLEQQYKPVFGLQSISFKDEQHGIAVGQFGKIVITTDGGDTWVYCSELPQGIADRIPPTMVINWAGQVPIISAFGAGFWRYEEEEAVKDVVDNETISVKQTENSLLVSIQDSNFEEYYINIVDITGAVIRTERLSSGLGQLYIPVSIDGLNSGVYLYSVTRDGSVIHAAKFIIQK